MGLTIPEIISKFMINHINKEEFYLKIGTASEIDQDNFTFKFTPLDEKAPVEDVRMKTIEDSFLEALIVIPEEGSQVIVAFHSNTVGQCLVVKKAEKIIINSNSKTVVIQNDYNITCNDINVTTGSWDFNDGALGGLITIANLVTKLNLLVTEVNSLKNAMNTHIHPGVTVGAGVTGFSSTNVDDLTDFDKDDFEDTIIKH